MKYSYEWIPINNGLPTYADWYLVTIIPPYGSSFVKECWFDGGFWEYDTNDGRFNIIAWINLPEPYHENKGK